MTGLIIPSYTSSPRPKRSLTNWGEMYNIASLQNLSYWMRGDTTGTEAGFDITFPDVRGNGWVAKLPNSLTGTATSSTAPGYLANATHLRGDNNTDTRLDLYNGASTSVIGTSGTTTMEPWALYVVCHPMRGTVRIGGTSTISNHISLNIVNLEIRMQVRNSGSNNALTATVSSSLLEGPAGANYTGLGNNTVLLANNDLLIGFIRGGDQKLRIRYYTLGGGAWVEAINNTPADFATNRTFSLGCHYSSTGYTLNCPIAEAFLFNGDLSTETASRNTLEAYLVASYDM